ncbi:carbon monoxide dehydrogenase accessory protein CooC [soil metagenome]|jgi:CO dehydrogenase maturation factor|nr:AAA family ATPase [Acidimicrobiia bacterium]MBA3955089.1 AAA family ATPase [Acidimicrobiia bacterium]MDQ3461548.1 AAA family ATPase [Actinomycetota bacterium]
MRVALAGKGGAGKTTISATLCRVLARRGSPVVAIDGDSNPNLALALGIDRALSAAAPALPTSLVSRRLVGGPSLTAPVEEVVEAHSLAGPDGVRLVIMGEPGHSSEGCLCSAHATVSALMGDLGTRPDTITLVDMEASPEHMSRGTTRHADLLLLVTEPYYRSLEAVRRIARLAEELPIPHVALVANKVRSTSDAKAVMEFCERHEIEFWGEVPWSEEVVQADLAGVPLLDAVPDGTAVAAISRLADTIGDAAHAQTAAFTAAQGG